MVDGVQVAGPSAQVTPAQALPYIELPELWATVTLYGGHGCQPVRQLGSSAPLGSSAAATLCRMVYSGASKPMLVPKPHPAPAEGTTGEALVTPPVDR